MVQQSILLQIIQFVGLIAPALAILIELLVRFYGGLSELESSNKLPIEIQILIFAISSILVGGMVIGLQFGLTLNNQVTQFATLAIFGGLPFLTLSLLIINVRISSISRPDTSTLDDLLFGIRLSISILLPISLSLFLYFVPFYWFQDTLNDLVGWWVFLDELQPVWYFYVISIFALYKTSYSLWVHNKIPSTNYSEILEHWFVVSFTIYAFMIIFAGLPFVVFFGLLELNISFITQTSPILAVPFILGFLLILVVVYVEIDPDSD